MAGDFIVGLDTRLEAGEGGIQLTLQFIHRAAQTQHFGVVFAHDAIFNHELQAHLAVNQLLANAQERGVLDNISRRVHEFFAFQIFQLVQAGFTHQHFHAGRTAFALQHAQTGGFDAIAGHPPPN